MNIVANNIGDVQLSWVQFDNDGIDFWWVRFNCPNKILFNSVHLLAAYDLVIIIVGLKNKIFYFILLSKTD